MLFLRASRSTSTRCRRICAARSEPILVAVLASVASIAGAAAGSLPQPNRPMPAAIQEGFRQEVMAPGACADFKLAVDAGLPEESVDALDACWRAYIAKDVIWLPGVDYLSREVRAADGVIPSAPTSERFRLYIVMFWCPEWKDYRYGRDDEQEVLDACWDEFQPRA